MGNRRSAVGLACIAICVAIALAGCGGGNGGGSNSVGAEPTGGSWRTVLLPSASAVSVPAPPAQGSAQETQELQELRDLRTQRPTRSVATATFWSAGAVVRWNETARGPVMKHRIDPPMASRLYALLYEAAISRVYGGILYRFDSDAGLKAGRRIAALAIQRARTDGAP